MWSDRAAAPALVPAIDRLAGLVPEAPVRSRHRLAPSPDPAAVVAPLATEPGTVWLDDGPAARHLVAARPRLQLVCDATGCRVTAADREVELGIPAWDALDALLEALRRRGGGRLFGYLAYELGAELERLPPLPDDDLGLPRLWMGVHDGWLESEGGRWWRVGEPGIEDLADGDLPEPEEVPPRVGPLRSRPGPAAFRDAVRRTVRRIHAGELFQTNLCRRLEASFPGAAAWPLYLRLRRASPARRGAFLRVGADRAALSVSPETYLAVRDGHVVSEPIKGTRARDGEATGDERRGRELLDSDKDAAELAMIVDLVRNDLGRVCRPGSVRVDAFQELMYLPGVLHTRARVSGRLRQGADAVDLLRASFPPGSITGAPKIQAMAVAAGEEERIRGPAMGAIGWIDADGDLDLSVAIRTAAMGNGILAYHAGCGIVADSDPQTELEESRTKAHALLEALGGVREVP